MKNVSPANNSARKFAAQGKLWVKAMRNLTPQRRKLAARALTMSLLLLSVALTPILAPFAQKKEGTVKVTGVSSHKSGDGTVVTVSADAPLTRTQTWQDEEGFHLTLPNAGPGDLKGLPRGVTVRNLGKSLEVVVALKKGAGVTVDPQFNHLNLIVNGAVDASQGEASLAAPSVKSNAEANGVEAQPNYSAPSRQPRAQRAVPEAEPASSSSKSNPFLEYTPRSSSPSTATLPLAPAVQPTAPVTTQPVPQASAAPNNATPAQQQLVPATSDGTAAPPAAVVETKPEESGGFFSSLFSTTGMLVLMFIGLGVLLIVRRRASDGLEDVEEKDKDKDVVVLAPVGDAVAEERPKKERRRRSRRASDQSLVKASTVSNQEMEMVTEGAMEKRAVTAAAQPALFGAYRVDQEVGKLVLGQAHRMDVLASRAPDDRRAIETSLIKALTAPESGEEGRSRAREALEEYGFVARQCASLLLANNAYDRASSARVLGEVSSQSSMPFLLEALYDSEIIVRSEAVKSLGLLKMPSAIGALLDMARRHPEMPSSIISNALNACTFQSLDFLDMPSFDLPLLESGDETSYAGEITHLDPSAAVEELPEWFEDEELAESLARLKETDVEARASAARRLAQFPVQRSVEALTAIAENDVEAAVRAAAVTSLSEIAHESVFAPVIMAFGDEAREVRAAAARALSRMDFDRAEAYVRLIETADAEKLQKVAQACIKAGMASQAIERLISEDRRLAYEAFSLLSLLAKSGEIEPLVDAICDHGEVNVRLAIVRLLGTSGGPEVATTLRHLAVRDGLPEKVRSSIMEAVYKMDQLAEVRS
jgi:HEAT repeat protein